MLNLYSDNNKNNIMKKSIIMLASALLASTVLTANAQYQVIYGDKQINGDNISFVKKGKWVKAQPTVSDWVDVGPATNCSAWTPDPSTVAAGTTFTQTASNCTQEQSRTTQNREQNDYTLVYRNVGNPISESQTLTDYSITRSAVGTKIVEDCGNGDINSYRWVAGTPSFGVFYIIWDGVKLFETGEYAITEKIFNGYKYTKGIQTSNFGYYTYHKLCRTPI